MRFFADDMQCPEDYWDTCQEAGPASRPQARFEEQLPTLEICAISESRLTFLGCIDCFKICVSSSIQALLYASRLPSTVTANLSGREETLQKKISQFNAENDVSLICKLQEHGRAGTVQGTSASSRTNPGSTPPRSRTVCQPVFTAPNVPINPQATGVPSCILDGSELQAKKLSSCT